MTGSQRIGMFGAQKNDLPAIWATLIDAGFETGHTKANGGLDWATLAAGLLYMGLTQAAEIQRQLQAHGMAAETPVALVENGTSCRQRVIEGELNQLALLAQQAASPSLIIVGSVVSLRSKLNWFASRSATPDLAKMA